MEHRPQFKAALIRAPKDSVIAPTCFVHCTCFQQARGPCACGAVPVSDKMFRFVDRFGDQNRNSSL
jgi:hypothetical protein